MDKEDTALQIVLEFLQKPSLWGWYTQAFAWPPKPSLISEVVVPGDGIMYKASVSITNPNPGKIEVHSSVHSEMLEMADPAFFKKLHLLIKELLSLEYMDCYT